MATARPSGPAGTCDVASGCAHGSDRHHRSLSARRLRLGRATGAKETLIGHTGTVRSIEFRPDGAMLSSVGFDGSVNIWELAKRPENRFVPRGSERVLCVAFSPDNRVLAVGSQTAAVTLHDLVADRSWAIEDTIAASAGASCLAFAPDGATLAVGQQGGKISLWDTATGRIRSTLDGHSEFVPSLVFAPTAQRWRPPAVTTVYGSGTSQRAENDL